MIDFVSGDFFDYDADIRINTVNCVGVMGAGVALAFKKRYPNMFLQYKKDCDSGALKVGFPTIWHEGDMFSKQLEIINFPTKDHWRSKSKYEYIESGLRWLAHYLSDKHDKTVTLPALGCGHGGLDWDVVKKMIVTYLSSSPSKILVFEPHSSRAIKKDGVNLADQQLNELKIHGVTLIKSDNLNYPEHLKLYTEKNLYIHGRLMEKKRFDITFIVSSKLTNEEKSIFDLLVKDSISRRKAIFFGSSIIEKRQLQRALSEKILTGICYPSGILKEIQKMNLKDEGLISLSIGNPFGGFNRGDFLPSVFTRVFLSEVVVFVTPRLDWLQKNMQILKRAQSDFYYVSKDLSENNVSSLENLRAHPYEELINN